MPSIPYTFQAELLPAEPGGVYIVVSPEWPPLAGKARLAVVAHFDGAKYQGSVAKMGGIYCLLVRKDIRAQINKQVGDIITVTLAADTAPRVVQLPPELEAALAQHPTAQSVFARTAYTRQKEICSHVAAAQKAETRTRRALAACEQLAAWGQPPAWFTSLLAEHPGAQMGFNVLAPSHQQAHLAHILEARKPSTQRQRALNCLAALSEPQP